MRFNIFSLNKFCKFNEVFDDEAQKKLEDDCYNIIMVQESRRLNDIAFKNIYNGKAYKALFDSTENAMPQRASVGIYAQEGIFDIFPDSNLRMMKVPTLSLDDSGNMFEVINKGIMLNIPINNTSLTIMSLHSAPPYQRTFRELSFVVHKLNRYNGYWMFIAEYESDAAQNLIGEDSCASLNINAERIAETDHFCISSKNMNEIMKVLPICSDHNSIDDTACRIRIDIPTDSDVQEGGQLNE